MDFASILKSGDVVLIATLVILLIMSIVSWCIAVLKCISFYSAHKKDNQFLKSVLETDNIKDVVSRTYQLKAPMPNLTTLVLKAKEDYFNKNLVQLQKQVSFDEFITRQIKKGIIREMQPYNAWLTVLASIGSIAPFVGLFGTVIGIHHALIGISVAGQVSIAEVSGPIGEALIATAFGLFVAVPAVLFYNIFTRKSRKLNSDLVQYSDDLRTQVISEEV